MTVGMTRTHRILGSIAALLLLVAASGGLAAQVAPGTTPGGSGLPLPRFVSLRASEVNLRTGPGVRYPIDWVYRRRGLPVEVIDEFETWRRIRDHEGTIGWVHQSLLQSRRNVLVREQAWVLRRTPEVDAPGVARLEPGVVGRLDACETGWCRVEVKGFRGWLPRAAIYGLGPGD